MHLELFWPETRSPCFRSGHPGEGPEEDAGQGRQLAAEELGLPVREHHGVPPPTRKTSPDNPLKKRAIEGGKSVKGIRLVDRK